VSLAARTALITGASQGLGLEIARAYLRAGASVVICARSEGPLREAESELSALGDVAAHAADVASPADVAALVAFAAERLGGLDVLVNNAGVWGPKGAIDEVGWDEWRGAIETNLFGSVLLARAVLPHLRRSERGKLVQLSGGGATSPMPFVSAYAASKAGVVRFVETLAGEVAEDGIDVNAVAPGALNTRMLDEILEAGAERVGDEQYAKALAQRENGGASLENAASLAVFLGSRASDGITGRLISAVWDPWESLADRRAELAGSDVYTLRRILPGERGMAWGERG
jgi:NAD(P)-dependent dehydrogenase (short-subunit alcohol dehydrogenase family)